MSFLVLDNSKVEVTEEGKTLRCIIDLYSSDRHHSKKFFNDAITYIFFSYKKDGIYSNRLPKSRKQFIIDKHLPERKIEEFERNPRVKTVIDLYIDLEFTPVERLYEGLKRDIEDLLKRLDNIPYEVERKIEFECEVEGPDGKTIRKFTQKVMVDNSCEKDKAMTLAIKLVDYENKLKSKVYEGDKEKRRSLTAKFDKSPEK